MADQLVDQLVELKAVQMVRWTADSTEAKSVDKKEWSLVESLADNLERPWVEPSGQLLVD
jgi:hypothetical protein